MKLILGEIGFFIAARRFIVLEACMSYEQEICCTLEMKCDFGQGLCY